MNPASGSALLASGGNLFASRRRDAPARLLPHDFHVAHGAVTLSIMSLKVAIPRLVLLPVLLLTVAAASCGEGVRESTLRIHVEKGKGHSGLGVEHCKRSVRPNEILKDISVRDGDGTEIAHATVRGRDATVTWSDGQRCLVKAEVTLRVPIGNIVEYGPGNGSSDVRLVADGKGVPLHVHMGRGPLIGRGPYSFDEVWLLARGNGGCRGP